MPSIGLALGPGFYLPSGSGDSSAGGALDTYTQPSPDQAFTYRAPGGVDIYLQP